ncbi:tetratricopeptide repeat protein, partial [bacterium]|nr:tetratricopeptide repeat protein [bacterium]
VYESSLAMAYIDKRRYAEAESILKDVLKKKPHCQPCAHDLAQLFLLTGQFGPAASLLSRLAADEPDNALYARQLEAARNGIERASPPEP